MSRITRTDRGKLRVAPDVPIVVSPPAGAPTSIVLLDECDSSWRALNRALSESPCPSAVRPVLFQPHRWFEGVCSLVITDVSAGVTLEALRREVLGEYRDILPLRGLQTPRSVETRRALARAIGTDPGTRVFANHRLARKIRTCAERRGLAVTVVA